MDSSKILPIVMMRDWPHIFVQGKIRQAVQVVLQLLKEEPMSKPKIAIMSALREGKPIAEFGYLRPTADAMLDELAWWTNALKAARQATAKSATMAAE
jgi:hypothetical protein